MNKIQMEKPKGPFWSISQEDLYGIFQVSGEKGLSRNEARKRAKKFGANRLISPGTRPAWSILLDQFKNFIMVLLGVAMLLALLFGQWLEGLSIGIAIVINGAIGFFTELKATRSMEALRRMSRISSKVLRDGRITEIPAEEMVPGDVVVVEGGDLVSADLRLVEASRLQTDESALTGESVSVKKEVSTLDESTPLHERKNMLFKGTAVTGGSGKSLAVATGTDTELGRIATLVQGAEDVQTPIEKRLNKLGYKLIWITLLIAAFVAVSGVIAGQNPLLIIETAIALAVAAIPEGLPIVAALALARGMFRLSKHNALMHNLSAVETLGSTSVICTDKTGTLTENQLKLAQIDLPSEDKSIYGINVNETGGGLSISGQPLNPEEHHDVREILETGVLCNNASLAGDNPKDAGRGVGDPLEIALLVAGYRANIKRASLLDSMPEVREDAFDPQVMMMATFHQANNAYRVAVKGAPESVIEKCSAVRVSRKDMPMDRKNISEWLDRNKQMADKGLRVLAIATKNVENSDINPYPKFNPIMNTTTVISVG